MLEPIIATNLVGEKLESEMLKRVINHLKLWLFPEIDAAQMRESFYRAFRG